MSHSTMSIAPRFRCAAPCSCVVFVSACAADHTPSGEALVCFCSHPYEDHETGITPQVVAAVLPVKGGCTENQCPRFTYTLSSPLNPQSLCSARTPTGICARPWLAHSLPATVTSSSTSTATSPLAQVMVSPTVPPAALWQASTSRGHGPEVMTTETTNDRRVAHYSSQRVLGVTAGPFGTSAPTGRRLSGNTRTPRLSLRTISGGHANSTGLGASGPLTETFEILIIPYNLFRNTSDAHDPFRGSFYVYSAKLPRLQRQLSEYKLSLMTTVTAATDDTPVWTQVGDVVFTHLAENGYHLQRYPASFVTPGSREYTEEGYQFIAPGNYRDGGRKLKEMEQPGRLINLRFLKETASKIPNPRGQNPLLWICPTLSNITGPLPENLQLPPGLHCCLARRAMDGFLSEDRLESAESIGCLPECPSTRQTQFRLVGSAVPDIPAPFQPSDSAQISGCGVQDSGTSGPSDSDLQSIGPFDISMVPQFNHLVHSNPPSYLQLSNGAVYLVSWQQEVTQDLWEPVTPSGDVLPPPGRRLLGNTIVRFHLSAPSVDVAAKTFIKWIQGKFRGQPVTLPPMVEIDQRFDLNNIFHSRRLWNVGSGVGVGVERSVLGRVIELSANDLKLCRGDCDIKTGYKNLNLSSIVNTPQRWNDFQALGWMSASYIFMTGLGPAPISPILPLFAIGGWTALSDLWLIKQVMPDHADILHQWPVHYDDRTTINLTPGSNLATLIIEYLDLNPAELVGLDQAAWNAVTKAFYSAVLFGSQDPNASESSPITNFVNGFKTRVSRTLNLCDTLLKDDRYKVIIPAIYNRSIRNPIDLVTNLKFVSAEDNDISYPAERHGSSQALPITEEVETLFTHKLHRYLQGHGHPEHPAIAAHLPAEEEHDGSHDDHVLRARLFLRFSTGSELLPAGAWTISIIFLNDLPPEHVHRIPQDAGVDWQPLPIPLYAQTCNRQVQVAINKTTLEYITEPLPHNDDGTTVTMFDVWIHTSLMRSGGAYDFNTA